MAYNFVADSVHTKKLYSRRFSSEAQFYRENGRFEFVSPLWGLGASYDIHFRFTGKRVVDFLLVLIDFLLCVTAESLLLFSMCNSLCRR